MTADRPATEPIEPVTFPCPNCGEGITLRGHFDHSEAAQGAAPRAEGLDRKTLSMALHSLLPMDPGHWTVWQPNDFGGGKDVPANSAEFADAILARLSRPSDERVPKSEEPQEGRAE